MKKPSWKVWIKVKMVDVPHWKDTVPIGSMLDWDDYYPQQSGAYEEREPFEFTATLAIEGYYRGRSAAGFNLLGPNGEQYVIRIAELTNMLKNGTVANGKISGRWGFKKQGANYSLTYLGEA